MDGIFMNAYELADTLNECIDDGSTDLYCVCHAAKMLRQQADRILELEAELLAVKMQLKEMRILP
jgi:hypothetical protein